MQQASRKIFKPAQHNAILYANEERIMRSLKKYTIESNFSKRSLNTDSKIEIIQSSPMKKAVIVLTVMLLLVLLLFASTAYALSDFTTSIIGGKDSIKQNETAVYKLQIGHPFGQPRLFEIYSTDVLWDVRTQKTLEVLPGTNFETELYLRPLNLNPGVYSIPLDIKMTGTQQTIHQELQMEITSQFPPTAAYLPAIRGTVTMSRKMDPKDPIRVYVKLENQNKKTLNNVKVKLRSSVINKDYDISLKPLETKKLTFEAVIDPLTPPQEDTMKVTVVSIEGPEVYQFELVSVPFTVVSYEDFEKDLVDETTTLKTIRTITLTNKGNAPYVDKYRLPTNLIHSMFTTSQPEALKLGTEFVWDLNLQKGETQTIVITTNYRPLAFLILALAVLVVAYFIFRSPIIMTKQAAVVGTREGGISELKILLTIKNRSNSRVKSVNIIDLVPRIATLKQDQEIGTVMPDKTIHNEIQGTLLKWNIDQIEPREERLISYKIQSKLSILGGVTLPVAVARFITEKGRTRNSNSNKTKIGFLG